MNTYQILLMRPYELILALDGYDDLSDLQYMATDVQGKNPTTACRKALDELRKVDKREGFYVNDNYTVIGHFLDGVWYPCFNQPRWRGH